jgi:hypothetical protein
MNDFFSSMKIGDPGISEKPHVCGEPVTPFQEKIG